MGRMGLGNSGATAEHHALTPPMARPELAERSILLADPRFQQPARVNRAGVVGQGSPQPSSTMRSARDHPACSIRPFERFTNVTTD